MDIPGWLPLSEYWTELALALNISRAAVYQRARRNALPIPVMANGGRYYVAVDDWNRWMVLGVLPMKHRQKS